MCAETVGLKLRSLMHLLTVFLIQLSVHFYGAVSDDVNILTTSEIQFPHQVQRRGFVQLCYQLDMILDPNCLQYTDYGCYCGLGGSGVPLDDIDRCCQKHDQCYKQVRCIFRLYSYFVQYNVDCSPGHCRCLDSLTSDSCAYTTCECDRQLAKCIFESPPMNSTYKQYDRRNC